jgi:bifunctional ADP-heptose synthase (sugar kinase/adenylyltransferase)
MINRYKYGLSIEFVLMIVTWSGLPDITGQVVMVDGSFDPIHEGHIAYFAAAERLGHPVLCNISPDDWTQKKHPVLLSQQPRAFVIDAIRSIAYVHCATTSTRDVLKQLRPIAYVKGNDWLAKGGVPKDEVEICLQLGIEITYVDTVLNSSTKLIEQVRKT